MRRKHRFLASILQPFLPVFVGGLLVFAETAMEEQASEGLERAASISALILRLRNENFKQWCSFPGIPRNEKVRWDRAFAFHVIFQPGKLGNCVSFSYLPRKMNAIHPTEPIVVARSASLKFPSGTQALRGMDIDIGQGEFVSLVGPSGCGKSTFLRLVAGLLTATEGSISVAGQNPTSARRGLHPCGFVFQSPNLLPWRTVLDNILLPLELDGVARPEREARARMWLDRVGLADFAKAWPAQLSGGMRMRVSIARALASQPRILLMDEPFAALDDITRGRLQEDLLRLRTSEGFTTIFVTHNVAEAAFLSDRVAVVSARPGRIAAQTAVEFGQPRDADLRGEPAFAAKVREIGQLLSGAAT